jgi:hypothetical protein
MKTPAFLLGLFVGLGLAACDVDTPAVDPGDSSLGSDRGHGKADGPLEGSCFAGDVDACGGPAPIGSCWCDDLCEAYGDCCADKHDVCGPTGPTLCLADDQCSAGQLCDHTECLSGCSGDEICPAVCFGQCVDAPVDCNLNVQQALPCGPGTQLDPSTCACTPVCDVPAGYAAVEASEILADPPSFAGQQVAVTGPAVMGLVACTKIACPDTDPCCNACFAGLQLVTADGQLELSGMGCGGNECTVADNCTVPPGTPVTAWGIVAESFGFVHLEVDGYCG